MLFYSSERFIRAHQDTSHSYYNYSYDRYVRDAICSKCGKVIGEQVKYSGEKIFSFLTYEYRKYNYCPYCGEPFCK